MLNIFFKLLSLREDYRKILVKNRSESFIPHQLSHFESRIDQHSGKFVQEPETISEVSKLRNPLSAIQKTIRVV